jgi:hypothetical protein
MSLNWSKREEKRLLKSIIITCSNKLFTYLWTSRISIAKVTDSLKVSIPALNERDLRCFLSSDLRFIYVTKMVPTTPTIVPKIADKTGMTDFINSVVSGVISWLSLFWITNLTLRIRSKTGGKLVCRRDCLLHSLVVRRFAQRNKRMIRSVVAGSEATGYNA